MWIYPFIFFINVMLQGAIGFKTNDWGYPIFAIIALGVILVMVQLGEINKSINKSKQTKD